MIPLHLLILSFTLQADTVYPKICVPNEPDKCVQPLRLGQVAQFDGQMFTTSLAIDLGQKATGCDTKLSIETGRLSALNKIEVDRVNILRDIEKQTMQSQIDLLNRKYEEAVRSRPWYESPLFIASVSSAVTIAACALAVKGAQSLK